LSGSPTTVPVPAAADIADSDADGVPNDRDNCSRVPNPGLLDADADGYGNACDPDLNDDGVINFLDVGLFRIASLAGDLDTDFSGDGLVNSGDLAVLRDFWLRSPGPGLE